MNNDPPPFPFVKEFIAEYLRQNLKINVKVNDGWGDYSGRCKTLSIELVLEGDTISYSCESLN